MSSRKVAAALSALTVVLIVLQGVWAGLFLSTDDRSESWIHVHDIGAGVTLICSLLAAAWVTWRCRADRVGWAGSVALVVLIAGEAHLGGLITDNGDDGLTAVHVPLALALTALAVWLPVRFGRASAGNGVLLHSSASAAAQGSDGSGDDQ